MSKEYTRKETLQQPEKVFFTQKDKNPLINRIEMG